MNNKKLIWIIVGVVVIAGLGIWAWQMYGHRPVSTSQTQTKAFDPKNPPWIVGNLVSISPDKVELKSSGQTLTGMISANTKLVKQVTDKKGLVQVVNATLADFQTNAMIVVYFSQPGQGNVYQADKIQIISQ